MIRVVLVAFSICLQAAPRVEALDLYSVGSGDSLGNYYATARAICDVLNRADGDEARCSPEPTSGSIYNLAMLREGEMDFALVQSDWQKAAYDATSRFAGQPPMTELRSVMSLYPETITVLAAVGSGIREAADLADKRIDIGLPSSGRHATIRELIERLGYDNQSFAELAELAPRQSGDELCSGGIDAAIYVTGHPDGRVADLVERCGARIIPFDGPRVRATLGSSPEFVAISLPVGLYFGQTAPIASYAVYATVVTRADVPESWVEAFVSGVIDNLPALERRVPVLGSLDPGTMRSRGLTAPLHPGAASAFAAAGP